MEDEMTALKSLTFTTLPSQSGNPILDRRAKIIARLEEQKLVLKDPNYTRTNRKWVKKDGERVMVEQQQRVPLWWRQHPNGSYALFVRSGDQRINHRWQLIKRRNGNCGLTFFELDCLQSLGANHLFGSTLDPT
jgi:hypothetical protein